MNYCFFTAVDPKYSCLTALHPQKQIPCTLCTPCTWNLWPKFFLTLVFLRCRASILHTLSPFSLFSLFSHTTAPTFSLFSLFSHTTAPTPSFSLLHTPFFSPASATAFHIFPPLLHFSQYVCILILIDFSCRFECVHLRCFVLNLLRK